MNGSVIRKIIGVVALAACLIIIMLLGQLVVFNHASESIVIQYPNGTVVAETQPGPYMRWFGHVERYPKSFQFWFSEQSDQGSKTDESILCRFNDGGHANISGSTRIVMPTDDANLKAIFANYVTQERLEHELVKPCIQKAVYFAGPLMSSKESAGVKRTLLSQYIEDQAQLGVYSTQNKEVKEPDPITGELKTVTVVEIAKEAKTGQPIRQEPSALDKFHISLTAMSLNRIRYDDTVEKQIQQQQGLTMQIQTAVAQAKTAEQQALTAAKEGEANAAKSRWQQEVIRAQKVTEAQQERDIVIIQAEKSYSNEVILASQRLRVAELNKQSAEQDKQAAILTGEGKARAATLEMEANGALMPKIQALIEINKNYAEHLPANLVPSVVMGGSGQAGSSGMDFISLLMAKTAKDLSLDLSMQGAARPALPTAAAAK